MKLLIHSQISTVQPLAKWFHPILHRSYAHLSTLGLKLIHVTVYTASINCCKNILLQRSHNYGVWNYRQQKLLYFICYTMWIDWHMIFGLEQEGGGLIAPMALAHPLHPIDNGSRNRRRNLWVGWCVSSWWPLFPSRSSVFIYIYIYIFFHTSSVIFGLPKVSCSLMIIV